VASSEFTDSGSLSTHETVVVEELFVHLFNWKILWTENNQVHMGIDVHLVFTYGFSCAFEKPYPTVYVVFPKVIFSDCFEASDHFISGFADCCLENILVDSTFTEPSPGYHSDMVVDSFVELVY